MTETALVETTETYTLVAVRGPILVRGFGRSMRRRCADGLDLTAVGLVE